MFEKQLEIRNEIINQMKTEMLGPGSEPNCIDSEHELISSNPEKRYCIGILYPQGIEFKMEDDDSISEDNSSMESLDEETMEADEKEKTALLKEELRKEKSYQNKADSEENMDETVSMSTKLLPSSMGITFVSNKKLNNLMVNVTFGTYRSVQLSECLIRIDDSIADSFSVPEVFSSYFSYDKETKILKLLAKIEKKMIREIYEADRADDGTFKPYAFKMIEILDDGFKREPHQFPVSISFEENDYFNPSNCLGDTNAKVCALRFKFNNGYYSYTVMLLNNEHAKASGKNSIFQPKIVVSTDDNPELIFCDYEMVQGSNAYEDEEESNALLYRNKKNYGTGLGTALKWEIDDNGKGTIENDFFPKVEVPQMEFAVNPKYNVAVQAFDMKYLSDLDDTDKAQKIDALHSILVAYKAWIEELEATSRELPSQYGTAAKRHISNCKYCLERLERGITVLKTNSSAWDAFQLANRAMYMQRVHVGIQAKYDSVYPNEGTDYDELTELLEDINYYSISDICTWRPFQIAFLLMSINSITNSDDDNEDRNVVDLIWFPTGGGKTEAYLGLTAFTIFYRRLSYQSASGGTTVIMRYTLRLLAAQQYTRAATLICACEYIRKECEKRRSKYPKYELGKEKITIGLWIGREHTPNKLKDGDYSAKECHKKLSEAKPSNLKITKEQYGKFQVLKCPWCGTKMVKDLNEDGKTMKGLWGYNMSDGKRFYMNCTNDSCAFNKELPLQVVDEELYKNPPTLLFATVDKFAMLPWEPRIGNFFAVGNEKRTPELIIQDELHLISGPLGSMIGLYETVIDYLCSKKGSKPKIIASTATICRAKEQCSSLYNREVFQYPPQGLDESDSFFARSADVEEKYGRTYIGLLPAGKTKATMEGKVLAGLLQLEQELDTSDEIKDCYWTNTAYFNSLKELGKCATIVQNDVRDNILRLARRNYELKGKRSILRADELTSRVSTTELNQTLEKLEKIKFSSDPEKKTYPSNMLLATNMISVGIDVDRLNVMVMIGQPKLTSEYIQASSRVGRKYPGVVFTLYDGTRSRDRSHYEQFKAYHESFYRYVEPTGVTPFSEPARKRALHAAVISMIRHGMGLATDEQLSTFDKELMSDTLKEISDYITSRLEDINARLSFEVDSGKEETAQEIDDIYETIQILSNQTDGGIEYGNVAGFKPKNESHARLMKPFGVDELEPYTYDTLTSMRNVDGSVNVNIVELEVEYE